MEFIYISEFSPQSLRNFLVYPFALSCFVLFSTVDTPCKWDASALFAPELLILVTPIKLLDVSISILTLQIPIVCSWYIFYFLEYFLWYLFCWTFLITPILFSFRCSLTPSVMLLNRYFRITLTVFCSSMA